jgi:molybdenum cofactor cytidylyltransferase
MSVGLCGVILAAGESSRMGRDKALLPWPKPRPSETGGMPARHGGTILSAAIHAFVNYCDLVIVIAGTNESALRPIVEGCGASLIRNPAPERGQFSSLQTGLREVLGRGRDSAMVTLVDRPPANSRTLANLLDAFRARPYGNWAVVPEYQAAHGHPILIGREMIEKFLRAPVTSSARDIEHANQDRILYVAVDDRAVTINIDTPEDYASLE